MKRVLVLSMMVLLVAGLAISGCSKKTTGGPGTAMDAGSGGMAVNNEPLKWTYDTAPTPPFNGTVAYRLTSFGFDEGAAIMRSEGMGACREAVKKLPDKNAAMFLIVGFADGIKETNRADVLGTQRAEATRRFLGTLGIKADQCQLASFGSHYSTAKDFEKIKLGSERKAEIWLMQQ